MTSRKGEKAPSKDVKESRGRAFLAKLKKRHIIEILAAFIGGGWLLLEFVHWLLVDHYHFPEKTIDITFVTILGTLLCTLIWRWFSGEILGELDKLSGHVYVSKYYLAPIHAAMGDKEKAFELLESAYKERESDLIFLKTDPKFAVLRSDPRYEMMLRKIGLEK